MSFRKFRLFKNYTESKFIAIFDIAIFTNEKRLSIYYEQQNRTTFYIGVTNNLVNRVNQH